MQLLDEEGYPTGLDRTFHQLPFFNELYLRMQSQNITMVERYLCKMENQLLREWNADMDDRIPLERAIFLSAISQLWIFGLYELLRTWRSRTKEVIQYGTRLASITMKDHSRREEKIQQQRRKCEEQDYYETSFGMVEKDPLYHKTLQRVLSHVEPIFQTIELVRVALAKHEIHNTSRRAFAPGYARIDRETGSVIWFLDTKEEKRIQVTRREIADAFRDLKKHSVQITAEDQ